MTILSIGRAELQGTGSRDDSALVEPGMQAVIAQDLTEGQRGRAREW
jgi:hypothetical protein